MGVTLDVWRARIGSFCKVRHKVRVGPSIQECFNQASSIVLSLALINVLLLIGCLEANPGPDQYSCSACHTTFHSTQTYGQHQGVHLGDKNFSFPCHTCDHRFTKVSTYFTHVSRFHNQSESQRDQAPHMFADLMLDADFRCSETTCQENCRTAYLLKRHTEAHIKNGFVILCPFQPCNNRFTKVQTFRTHCSRYHKKIEKEEPEITFNDDENGIGFHDDAENNEEDLTENEEVFDNDDNDNDDDNDDDDDDESDEDSGFLDREYRSKRDNVFPSTSVRDRVGKFYLWLEGVLLIPTKKVQAISEELTLLLEISHHQLKVSMKEALMKEGIAENRTEQIVESVMKKDTVFATHHKGMDVVNLNTDYMRKQFFKNRYSLLNAEPIPLGINKSGKKRYAHYISIEDSLHVMLSDPTVRKQVDESFQKVNTPGIYKDFTDGCAYTGHPICGLMKSLQIILFQDAFEFYPLSPTSGTYKCVGFYFMLGNMDASSRSKVDAIQLAFVVKESDLKFFGKDKVLERLINELTELASNGIEYKGEKLPCVVINMCGDNLGQHFIGGYQESFTGTYYCRFCEATKKMIQLKPTTTLPFRTPDEYDEAVGQINPEDPEDSVKGIKKASVLNKIPFFHVCNPGLAPCVGHDILEGVAKMDFALFLRYFIHVKNWITLPTLNKRIDNFKCRGRDSADSLVNLDPSLKKIKGHASEVWLFVRLFPFLIADKIQDFDDPVWQLALLLKKICEYAFAPIISDEMLVKLKELTNLYLETRAKIFHKNLQPKHHYMAHIADLTALLGPLIRLWTLRFESRHVFFKSAAKAANNFKNITKTLVNKYVLNFAYKFSGQLFPQNVIFRDKDATPTASVLQDVKPEILKILKTNPSYSTILHSAEVHGITYCPGLWILLGRQDTELLVGEIVLIIHNGQDLKFILKTHLAENSLKGFYTILGENGLRTSLLKDFGDYYPLPAYEYQGQQCLTLKHAVPSMEKL